MFTCLWYRSRNIYWKHLLFPLVNIYLIGNFWEHAWNCGKCWYTHTHVIFSLLAFNCEHENASFHIFPFIVYLFALSWYMNKKFFFLSPVERKIILQISPNVLWKIKTMPMYSYLSFVNKRNIFSFSLSSMNEMLLCWECSFSIYSIYKNLIFLFLFIQLFIN